MSELKYKVDDKVRIKNIDWYNKNKDADNVVHCGNKVFDNYMSVFCGSVVTIGGVYPHNGYDIREDMQCRVWTDEMIEGLVEEENQKSELIPYFEEGTNKILYYKNKNTLECYFPMRTSEHICPEGYIFKDENGNVINATKIVLEKKKKEYPKTYEECCYVTGFENTEMVFEDDYRDIKPPKEQWKRLSLMNQFNKLLICRDAYWKIAGEEMGLGKPWSPTDSDYITGRYCIFVHRGNILCDTPAQDCVLTFPTEEMRDAFKENFDPDIEICKEFL